MNQFRQAVKPGGPVRQPYSCSVPIAPIDFLKILARTHYTVHSLYTGWFYSIPHTVFPARTKEGGTILPRLFPIPPFPRLAVSSLFTYNLETGLITNLHYMYRLIFFVGWYLCTTEAYFIANEGTETKVMIKRQKG
jgi:hypothetical protein